MAKKLLHIIGAFVLKFFSHENVSKLIDQLIDALYDSGDDYEDIDQLLEPLYDSGDDYEDV